MAERLPPQPARLVDQQQGRRALHTVGGHRARQMPAGRVRRVDADRHVEPVFVGEGFQRLAPVGVVLEDRVQGEHRPLAGSVGGGDADALRWPPQRAPSPGATRPGRDWLNLAIVEAHHAQCGDVGIARLPLNLFTNCVNVALDVAVDFPRVPLTARARSGWKMLRTRSSCGSAYCTQPGQSIWKASATTTRPRSAASVGASGRCAGAGAQPPRLAQPLGRARPRCRLRPGRTEGPGPAA